jgi:hypothetical protein
MEENLPKRNTPRDLFLHLLAIVTLYWSSITFVGILWQFINKFFPDVLWYGDIGRTELIRFFVSSLIIVFPVFILVSWYLNNIYRRETVVRESKIRKWLIYLTLFIAALVIIIDLVSTINMLMGGEITIRFILKALSVLIVAAIIFWYYLDDVRREIPTKLAKYFAWISGVLVLSAIICGIIIAGTPATARLQAFDQQKVSDLTGIQWEIVQYWQAKGTLPKSLSALTDKISGYTAPQDPQTKQPYEYIITNESNLSFQLCAIFNKLSQEKNTMPYYAGPEISQNWNHGIGRVCFDRTIDKQLYPVKKP